MTDEEISNHHHALVNALYLEIIDTWRKEPESLAHPGGWDGRKNRTTVHTRTARERVVKQKRLDIKDRWRDNPDVEALLLLILDQAATKLRIG